jgi:tetratricopeptide (TPR) repeat protein
MSKPHKKVIQRAQPSTSETQFPQRAGNLTTRLRQQFESLQDDLKKLLKQGCISMVTLEKAQELARFVNDNGLAIQRFIERSDDDHVMELCYLKSRCMLAEVFDQFGFRQQAKEASRDGAEILNQIPSGIDTTLQVVESRHVLREKIRLCIDYVQTHFYREHDYPEALRMVLRCRDFVERHLQRKGEFNCYGTLGQIYYVAGKIYRQQNDYGAAEQCFALAIENYYQRARTKIAQYQEAMQHQAAGDSEQQMQRLQEDLALTRLKTGIALALGIGWINYARGHLHEALNTNINPARVLLLHARDELSSAYLDLIYSSITRALSNKDAVKLSRAIEMAEGAYHVFLENEHWRYVGRAAWELGLTHFYSDNLDEAEQWAQKVEAMALESEDQRWVCNALILRSRIEYRRGQLNEARKTECFSLAEELASSASHNASQHRQTLCETNALITRSAIRIDLTKFAEARQDLEDALALNKESNSYMMSTTANPKLEALCYLHLSRSYAREGERFKANENFLRWKELERDVEHIYVRELAHEVEKEINNLKKDFVIKAGEAILYYKKWKKELQFFLLQEAENFPDDERQEIAERLGISRTTLLGWKKELKGQEE